jgi:hypothetical protein
VDVTTIFFNSLGIMGALLLLFGFFRTVSGKWTGKSFWYELDNVVGATFVIIYQIHYHAYVTVLLNAVWAAVAAWGLVSFFRRWRAHRKRRSKAKA